MRLTVKTLKGRHFEIRVQPSDTFDEAVFGIQATHKLLFIPVLDGRAILYSCVSTPEIRIGVAFGSGGGQSLPGTELPGVSSWLIHGARTIWKLLPTAPER